MNGTAGLLLALIGYAYDGIQGMWIGAAVGFCLGAAADYYARGWLYARVDRYEKMAAELMGDVKALRQMLNSSPHDSNADRLTQTATRWQSRIAAELHSHMCSVTQPLSHRYEIEADAAADRLVQKGHLPSDLVQQLKSHTGRVVPKIYDMIRDEALAHLAERLDRNPTVAAGADHPSCPATSPAHPA